MDSGGFNCSIPQHMPPFGLSVALRYYEHGMRGVDPDTGDAVLRTTINNDSLEAVLGKFKRAALARKKRRAQRRCAMLKEELMAAAWHPRRVWAWIEAGRWDMID
jgi:hypothetical protein